MRSAIARAIIAKRGDGGSSDRRDTENIITFKTPMLGGLTSGGQELFVDVLAATGGSKAYFLVQREDDSLDWLPADSVQLNPKRSS